MLGVRSDAITISWGWLKRRDDVALGLGRHEVE